MVRFVIISLTAVVCAVGAAQELSALGRHPAAPQVAVATAPEAAANGYGGDASIAKSSDGHFWADADVDGHPVHFLIDTGATYVALTSDDAQKLGIDLSSLNYNATVTTANGPARAAPVKLGVISVGRAEVSSVDAFVIDRGLGTSLLGMSYLGRLSKFEATPDAMILRS
ncbi:MAG: TIGR02281 family clan AA aspartic protease [Caulobacterales bacterium]